MTRFNTVLPVLALLAVSACSSEVAAPAPAQYRCQGGLTVEAQYPNPTTAIIALRGETHRLSLANSADGARYRGEGLEWWTKGSKEASLSEGNDAVIDCVAPDRIYPISSETRDLTQ